MMDRQHHPSSSHHHHHQHHHHHHHRHQSHDPLSSSRRLHVHATGRDDVHRKSTSAGSHDPSISRNRCPPSPPSWPPRPFVEEELLSLRRESGAERLLELARRGDDTPSRGSVDQEPVLIDVVLKPVDPLACSATPRSLNCGDGLPTPPSSEDDRPHRARRKPSRLDLSSLDRDDCVPDLSRRTASPYAFTAPARHQPEPSTPATAATFDRLRPAAAPSPASPRRTSRRLSPRAWRAEDYFSSASPTVECAVEDSDSYHSNPASTRRTATTPVSRDPAADSLSSNGAQPIRKLHLDARRNTDTQDTLPAVDGLRAEKTRRPTPLTPSAPNPSSADAYPRSQETSSSSARPVSPAGSTSGPGVVSRSPRFSSDMSRDGSAVGSTSASASSSRPPSPSPRITAHESPRVARTELDWSALLAANAARRSKPPSRLTPVVSASESARDAQRRSVSRADPSSSLHTLPYPEEGSLMGSAISMPEEHDHAYQPDKKPSSTSSSSSVPHRYDFVPRPPSPQHSQPPLERFHSAAAATLPLDSSRSVDSRSRHPPEHRRAESFATSSETRKELAALVKKGLPSCSRPEPVTGYDDWYTIIGATDLDFCPDCLDSLFQRTSFRPHFRRSPPRPLDIGVRCAFGSPWTRLAWLLTLQQQRTDLVLLKDLADIDATTAPCPGSAAALQSWYGLRDSDGRFVRDFHVCFADVRKLERLLPSLSGLFVKLPARASATREKQMCALRTGSTRFSTYLDELVATHERAVAARKPSDPMPLVTLAERKARLPECPRDGLRTGALWHVSADLPCWTVCADCFDAVVAPAARRGSSVAQRLPRAPRLVPSGSEASIGSSCQLYSHRSRRAFARAVEANDWSLLARRAAARRSAELSLHDEYRDVLRRVRRLDEVAAGAGGLDPDAAAARRLQRELERISKEWKEEWE